MWTPVLLELAWDPLERLTSMVDVWMAVSIGRTNLSIGRTKLSLGRTKRSIGRTKRSIGRTRTPSTSLVSIFSV